MTTHQQQPPPSDELDQLLHEMEASEADVHTLKLKLPPPPTTKIDDGTMMDEDMNHEQPHTHEFDQALDSNQLDTLRQQIRQLELQLKQTTAAAAAASPSNHSTLQVSSSTSSSKQPSYEHQKALFQIRKQLRAAYVRFIRADLVAAVSMDLETSLWKHTIYKQIENLRSLLKQCIPTKASNKSSSQFTRFETFIKLTKGFLREAMKLYEQLFFKHLMQTGWEAIAVERTHKKKKEQSTNQMEEKDDQPTISSQSGDETMDEDVPTQPFPSLPRLPHVLLRPIVVPPSDSIPLVLVSYETRQLYLQSCHRCLLFRGDLERYWQLISQEEETQRSKRTAQQILPTSAVSEPGQAATFSTPFKPNWHRVEKFYFLAVRLIPTLGNPWNQLSVIATYNHDTLLAAYRYFRALSASTPFLTAEVNLKLLFENTIDATVYASHQLKHANTATLKTPLFPNTPVCAHFMNTPWLDFGWVHLFHLLSTPNHAQLATALPCVANAVMMRFSQQMKQAATIRNDFALRLLLNFIYCIQLPNPSNLSKSDQSPPPIQSSSSALIICCEFLSLLMTSLHSCNNASIGVISVFLRWLQLHSDQLERISQLVPQPVRQAFLHNLAQLTNMAIDHLNTINPIIPTAGSTTSIAPLYEDNEILGIASLTSTASADVTLTNSNDIDEVDPRVDVRRCFRLVGLMQWLMTQPASGIVREANGHCRSSLDEKKEPMGAAALVTVSAKDATVIPPTPAAAAVPSAPSALRVSLPNSSGSSLLRSHRPPPGFAPLPNTAPLYRR